MILRRGASLSFGKWYGDCEARLGAPKLRVAFIMSRRVQSSFIMHDEDYMLESWKRVTASSYVSRQWTKTLIFNAPVSGGDNASSRHLLMMKAWRRRQRVCRKFSLATGPLPAGSCIATTNSASCAMVGLEVTP